MNEHTKTPWRVEKKHGQFHTIYSESLQDDARIAVCPQHEDITYEVAKANAAFIMQACNSHYKMVEALNEVMEEFNDRYDGAPDAKMQWMGHLMQTVQAALAGVNP